MAEKNQPGGMEGRRVRRRGGEVPPLTDADIENIEGAEQRMMKALVEAAASLFSREPPEEPWASPAGILAAFVEHWRVINGKVFHVPPSENEDGTVYSPPMREVTADFLIELLAVMRGVPIKKLKTVVNDFVAAESITARGKRSAPTPTPRPKWPHDAKPDEDPATFAARAGYEHRAQIYSKDRGLYRRLNSWLRSYDWPEGVRYVPTKSEWNDRQVAKGSALPVVSDEVREYHRGRKRVASARHRGVEPGM